MARRNHPTQDDPLPAPGVGGSLAGRLAALLELPPGARWAVAPPPGGGLALLALALARKAPAALLVLPHAHWADGVLLDAQALAEDGLPATLRFALLDTDGGDDPDAEGERIAVVERLTEAARSLEPAGLVVTCVQALMQPACDPRATTQATRTIAVGDAFDPREQVEALVAAGFERVPEVVAKRQVAVRGGLVDVWPLTTALPVRIDSAEDRVESLRLFDPGDQRSVERLQAVRLPPAAASSPRGDGGGTAEEPLPALLPDGAVVLWVEPAELERQARAFAEHAAPTLAFAGLRQRLERRGGIRQVAVGVAECGPGWTAVELPFAPLRGVAPVDGCGPDELANLRHARLGELERRALAEGLEVHLRLDTEGLREHLAAEVGSAPFRLGVAPLSGGFELPALGVAVLAQPDLYGHSKRGPARRPTASGAPRAGERLVSLEHLNVGDLVVHVDHGIGRYAGMTELEFNGLRREVLTVEYADNARLHVPVTHANLLTRYVGTGGAVRLHRLGGRRWASDKAAAERAVEDLAAAMLETQARRGHLRGHAFAPHTPWLHEFEASFPFAETPDQERCIAEVLRDLTAPHPMDRLVCGDAGYGKTEVAMRAAFVCAMQGRQVAVLVPTTVLAQQHFDTFRERMAAYPLTIAMHSRFCSQAERSEALRGAAAGGVDILIGTHGLLQPGVRFRDLGLVVIDEEQRFGVRHKEHFKTLRAMVDVLTLSATPIPRTLQLGLTGARDLSLLQTPPRERVATDTRIVRDSDEAIRHAIERELDRGGQVFFLYNRILTIERVRARLERLVPRARLAVAHGQMPAAQIESHMRSFAAGEVDVLLCTTIIESGVDIPRANTILVDRADRFGIADLYQLRGRVGRAARKGYALFLIPESGTLDAEARERLNALRLNAGAGAGFQLALRDLGIRGAGNLLGAAQSGHIAAVGFNLYCQLLRHTVARLKGEPPPPLVDVELRIDGLDLAPGAVDRGDTACLPYSYIEEDAQRIAAYRRLAEAGTATEIDALRQEWTDRYGAPPAAVRRLLRLARLRLRAAALGLQRVEVREGLVRLMAGGAPWPLRPGQALLHGATLDGRIAKLERLLGSLGRRPREPVAGSGSP